MLSHGVCELLGIGEDDRSCSEQSWALARLWACYSLARLPCRLVVLSVELANLGVCHVQLQALRHGILLVLSLPRLKDWD